MMYSVYVENIGMVIETDSADEAMAVFNEYCRQSKSGYGRAAGEVVVLFEDHESIKEFYPRAGVQS